MFLLRLGRDVDIVVRGARAGGRGAAPGRIHVRATVGRRPPAAAALAEAGAEFRTPRNRTLLIGP